MACLGPSRASTASAPSLRCERGGLSAGSADASRPRVRASACRCDSSPCEFTFTRHLDRRVNVNKREADLFARRCVTRSVRPAPRLSRPSMGRDTQLFPIQKSRQRQDGRGLGSQASRVVAGIRFPVMAGLRAPGPLALRGGNLRWAPAESPAVQAGIQAHATRRAKFLPALALAMCQPGSQTRSAWQKSAAGKVPQESNRTLACSSARQVRDQQHQFADVEGLGQVRLEARQQ